jgi:hypothetical protein
MPLPASLLHLSTGHGGALYQPFTKLDHIWTPAGLHLKNLLRLYEQYVQKNHTWLFQDAPRRTDLRLYEAVYHFNLFIWLSRFFQRTGGRVHPEFPTGNGQIDLFIHYHEHHYGLELKSFRSDFEYNLALGQAARYAHQLQLATITVVFLSKRWMMRRALVMKPPITMPTAVSPWNRCW